VMKEKVYLVVYFAFYLVGECLGQSFVDGFEIPLHMRKPVRWETLHNVLECPGLQCIYISMFKVKQNAYRSPFGNVQLQFRNDCFGAECCKKKFCTPYTAGRLSSVQLYDYGSFRWRALATSTFSTPPKDSRYRDKFLQTRKTKILSCFYLESEPANVLKISICISNSDPFQAFTNIQIGALSFKEYAQLDLNVQLKTATYRIDYHPCRVDFYVDGNKIRNIPATLIDIPYTKLKMKMGLFPAPGQKRPIYDDLSDRLMYQVNMQVFRARYIEGRELSMNIKEEPFTISETSTSPSRIFSVCVILVMFGFLLFCGVVRYRRIESTNRYALIFDSQRQSK